MRIVTASCLLFATACAPPSATLFIQDPAGLAGDADAIVLFVDDNEVQSLPLDTPGIGTEVSVTLTHDVEGAERLVLAVAQAGSEARGRAFTKVTFRRAGARYFAELRAVCASAADEAACALDGGLGDGVCVAGQCVAGACGDGIVSDGEACDAGGVVDLRCAYGDPDCQRCNANCRLVAGQVTRCGDGVRQPAEEDCDDGNDLPGDGCDAACRKEACGDGIVQPNQDEQCDDPDGNVANPARGGCRLDCTEARCGDLIVDADEDCDDGNAAAGDGCSALCAIEVCGDGVVNNDGAEGCDDGAGNVAMGSAGDCRTSCLRIECGDGITDLDEECDDGNDIDTDGCLPTCRIARCGDGAVREGVEECETQEATTPRCAYNETSCMRCDVDLCIWVDGATSYCGDGVLDQSEGELCDDGNSESFDGCSATCNYIIWDEQLISTIPQNVALISDYASAGLADFPTDHPQSVILPTADGVIHALNGTTGAQRWEYAMGEAPMGGARVWKGRLVALAADGRVHFVSDDGPDAGPPTDGGAPASRVVQMVRDGGVVEPSTDLLFGIFVARILGRDGSVWAAVNGTDKDPIGWNFVEQSQGYNAGCVGCPPCEAPGCRPSYVSLAGLVLHLPTQARLRRTGYGCPVDYDLRSDAGILGTVATLGDIDGEIGAGEISVAVIGDGRAIRLPTVFDPADAGCAPQDGEPIELDPPRVDLPGGGEATARLTSHPILFPLQGVSVIAAAQHGALVRFAATPGLSVPRTLMQDPDIAFQPYLTLDAEGFVYAADLDGRVYKVHGVSGQVAWIRDFGLGPLSASPLVGGNALYLTTAEGRVVAIEGGGTTAPAAGAWSRDNGNNLGVDGGSCAAVGGGSLPAFVFLLPLLLRRRRRDAAQM